MTNPIGSFQGTVSGIQWRDMVDQLIAVDQARALTPLVDERAKLQARSAGWTAIGDAATKLRDALAALQDGTAFRRIGASVPNSPTTNRVLVQVGSLTDAQPGRYKVESVRLATAEKLTGLAVSDQGAALGISGEFTINGVRVGVSAGDSLADVRDAINAANGGSTASRVTASILRVGGSARLVLNADRTGENGLELAEPSEPGSSVLRALGFVDATTSWNQTSDGAIRSIRVSSAKVAMASALGVLVSPPPASIRVNGRTIAVDLATDSITDIVARINGASPGAARTVAETDGAATWTRMLVAGAVESDGTAGSDRLLQTLGMTVGGRSGNVPQAVTMGTVLTGAGGGTATATTALADLGSGGTAAGVQPGDVIRLQGTDGAGTPVQYTYTVTGSDTVADLLAGLQGAFAGRAVTASLVDGRLRVTDGTTGESRLALAVTAGLAAGTLDFGAASTEFGRVRQVVAGGDAVAIIDGVRATSATNTFNGVVGGASLTLATAEANTVLDVAITSDPGSAASGVQALVQAYNDLAGAIAKETATGGRLPFASSARAIVGALNGVLLADMDGLAPGAPFARGGSVGLALQKGGQLAFDAAAFKAAVERDPAGVRALFATAGGASVPTVQWVGNGAATPSGSYALAVTQAATRAGTTGSALGSYVAGGTPATMTVTDRGSGKAATITLRGDDSAVMIAARLQAAFTAQAIPVTADSPGGALRLQSADYGSANGFTVAYTDDGGEAPASQLGISAGTYFNGADAAGTIDGQPAAAAGQLLTAPNGLMVRYTGTAATAAATVRFSTGLGGALQRLLDTALKQSTGIVDSQVKGASDRLTALDGRQVDIQARLDRRKAALLEQFARMESALSRFQAQGNWLAGQVASLRGNTGSGR